VRTFESHIQRNGYLVSILKGFVHDMGSLSICNSSDHHHEFL